MNEFRELMNKLEEVQGKLQYSKTSASGKKMKKLFPNTPTGKEQGQKWKNTLHIDKEEVFARKVIDMALHSPHFETIADDPNTPPSVGDVIMRHDDQFWFKYQDDEEIINRIMKKEHGADSIDDYLAKAHANYWADVKADGSAHPHHDRLTKD